MTYLLTAKKGNDKKQIIASDDTALNIIRRFMLNAQSMEETSASLKAMAFIGSISKGHAKAIENTKTGAVLVVQIH